MIHYLVWQLMNLLSWLPIMDARWTSGAAAAAAFKNDCLLSRFPSHAVSMYTIHRRSTTAREFLSASKKQYFLWLLISLIAPFHFHMTACTLVDRPRQTQDAIWGHREIETNRFQTSYPRGIWDMHINTLNHYANFCPFYDHQKTNIISEFTDKKYC